MQIAHEVIFAFHVQTGDFLDLILTVIWIQAQLRSAYRSEMPLQAWQLSK